MKNSTSAIVMGKGKIILKYTSAKLLSLSNVLYVPSLHGNLVSGVLLSKTWLKTILEITKLLSLNGVIVGKKYLNEGLFVLNFASETMN